MQIKDFNFIILWSLFNLHTQASPTQGYPPLNITVNTYNNQDQGMSSSSNKIGSKINDSLIQTLMATIKNNTQNTKTAIITHPIKSIAVLAFVSYAYFYYQLNQINSIMKNGQSWCNWRSVVPLNHLQQQNKNDITNELKIDIYKRCMINQVQTNLTAIFITEIKAELEQLNAYLHTYSIINKIGLTRFFYCKYPLALIEEKKQRLLFIFEMFVEQQSAQAYSW